MKFPNLIPITLFLTLLSTELAGQDFVEFFPDGDFANAAIEYDGMSNWQAQFGLGNGHPQDYQSEPATQTELDLWAANYGDITGNSLSRCSFEATMAVAFAADTGGVFGFEDANAIYNLAGDTDVDYMELVLGSGARVIVSPGTDHYVEGGGSDGYRGKRQPGWDGTGPSPIESGRPYPQFFRFSTFSGLDAVGTSTLREATSYDLDFDPADQVSVVGFAYINYNNFQNNQSERANLQDYPNVHAFADWTNGVDTITEMACGFSSGSSGNDYYFGFQQPAAGYFLDSLRMYSIGNDARCFNAIDELGIAVGNGAAVTVNPSDPELSISETSPGNLELEWSSEPCFWYEVKESADLQGFSPLAIPYLIKGDGTSQQMSFAAGASPSKEFYIVESTD